MFKRAWSDGTHRITLKPEALLTRLAALVPPLSRHVTRYPGLLAAARPVAGAHRAQASGAGGRWGLGVRRPAVGPVSLPAIPLSGVDGEVKPPRRGSYIPWKELLRRTFGSEGVCPSSGGPLKLIALVKTEEAIATVLSALGRATGPPKPVFS